MNSLLAAHDRNRESALSAYDKIKAVVFLDMDLDTPKGLDTTLTKISTGIIWLREQGIPAINDGPIYMFHSESEAMQFALV